MTLKIDTIDDSQGAKLDPIEEDIISEMQKIKKKDQPFWAR